MIQDSCENCVRVFTGGSHEPADSRTFSTYRAATSRLYVIDNEPSKHDHVI